MTENAQKDQRLNIRLTSDALARIKEAASICQQDVTSFLLGAGLDRSRAVLSEERILRLSERDAAEIVKALDREPEIIPALVKLFEKYGTDRTKT